MECQICSRHQSEVAGLHCPACARAGIFTLRLQQAQTLLENEQLGRQIEYALANETSSKTTPKTSKKGPVDLSRTLKSQKARDERHIIIHRVEAITQQSDHLRQQMKDLGSAIEQQRKENKLTRDELTRHKADLDRRRQSGIPSAKQAIQEKTCRYEDQYKDIVATRIQKAKAAATLAGLRQVIKPVEGSKKEPRYSMWNTSLPDIRQMHSAEPAHVSTVLYHVARLTTQLSKYLQVRLPAEIILPHADWPAPTIFSPASSYSDRVPQFPELYSSSSKKGKAKASRDSEQRAAGRSRPLFIDRKLSKLAKDDSLTYGLFVEGLALLAWDIAWLCRVQGLAVAEKEWDDVCNLGRNLWLLFANAPDQPSLTPRRTSTKDRVLSVKHVDNNKAFSPKIAPTALGVQSHASSCHYLESATQEYGMCDVSARGWAFAFPVKIIDELKSALLNDMSGHDWEMLDDRDEDLGDGTDAEENIVVDQTNHVEAFGASDRRADPRGQSGWMKLKSRPREDDD